MTFVLGMLKSPDAQRRGQSEIDSVVGADRLPSFEDKEKLPYVKAICEEVLREVQGIAVRITGYLTTLTGARVSRRLVRILRDVLGLRALQVKRIARNI